MAGKLAKANARIRAVTNDRIVRRKMENKIEYALLKNGNGRKVPRSPSVATAAELDTIVTFVLGDENAASAAVG